MGRNLAERGKAMLLGIATIFPFYNKNEMDIYTAVLGNQEHKTKGYTKQKSY